MQSQSPQREYHDPNALVTTEEVGESLNNPNARIVEVDYDPVLNYNQGHIPGAVLFDWKKDLNDPLTRNLVSRRGLEDLLGRNGVSNKTEVVLYGDFNNWFAAYAFWDLEYYGVKNVKLMNGGRKKWLLEDRPLTKDAPVYRRETFVASDADEKIRTYRDQVLEVLHRHGNTLVDVRGPKEFTGEVLAPPEYPTEHAQRGGHIPGAVSIPWGQAVNDADGTFKSRRELETLYKSKGVKPDQDVITYCRIGERSSHTWFVLKHLLGYPHVRNYDGSWTEWGNSVGLPVEK